MKVHITLKPSVWEDPQSRQRALDELVREYGLSCIQEHRFATYGLLTGQIEPKVLSTLQGLPYIESVTPDGEKFTS